MSRIGAIVVAITASCHSGPLAAPEVQPRIEVAAVAPASLCVTHGEVTPEKKTVRIADAAVRAVAPGSSGDAAELDFTYRGPTDQQVELASGDVRRQLGLKLRAENGCNLVYVMWRDAPERAVEVQVKRSRGMKTHEECGANGYARMRAGRRDTPPKLRKGSKHTLRAEIHGDELTAWIDGHVVWQGDLSEDARDLVGPAGLRSDGISFEGALLAAPAAKGSLAAAATCPEKEKEGEAPAAAKASTPTDAARRRAASGDGT